ncbi:NAD(P)-binding domain-containing protein [Variovorax rhizosphaerae]|uniref:NAD(P)-binding domain-containing protein n=1 Tax=Variovorax rhizosphaerae TaxID=1836200 RepID=A0ABU8WT85_9BURK
MNIGYIGLGSMGGALARHLVGKYPLTVWDLNSASCAAFKELGATVAPTAAELARQCDIILLCLPRTSDVHKLMFSPGGLAEGLSAGKLVVDQTSGVPGETVAIAKVLAKRGIEMIDAPVSGGVVGAAAGTITIMASGPQAQYDRALPVLNTISSNVFRCGERVGDGQAMKLVNNLLSAGCRLAALEVVALGRKLGLSLAAITGAINSGSACNRTTKVTLQSIVDGKAAVSNFAMALMLKDINQSIQLGKVCGVPTTLANSVRGLLQIGVSTLGKDVQFDRVMNLIESMADTHIVAPADDAEGAHPAASVAGEKELHLIQNAVAACNLLLTYEAASIAVAYGLKLSDVDMVINKSTGWSAASERVLPLLSPAKESSPVKLQAMVDDLKLASQLAIEQGAPMLIANAAGSLYEIGARKLGSQASIDSMAKLYESMAGVEFEGA